MRFLQKEERFGKYRLAGQPRLGLAQQRFPRPDVMLFARIQQCHQSTAVNEAAS